MDPSRERRNGADAPEYDLNRRRLLQAIAVGATVPAVSGLGRAKSTATVGAIRRGSGDGVHPVFGFTALSEEIDPPVEPDHEVQLEITEREASIPEFSFEPTGLFVEPGDTIKFALATPDHTITAYHPAFGRTQRVPDGVPPVSSPVLGGGAYWLYTFERPGVYDLLCAPHEIFGMVMRVVVGEASGPGAASLAAPEAVEGRPPELTAALVLEDEALAPEDIVEASSVSWSELRPESKRLLLEFVEE